MFWRAFAAFMALPGVVAFGVPLLWALHSGWRARCPVIGAAAIFVGTMLLLACVREFYVAGRGTLAPWAPPKHLVTSGPYRFSRNPMYIGVGLILAGWSTFYGSRSLMVYTFTVACAFHLRVILAEEPRAVREFGVEWDAYRARVPRWLLR
jgi:protein-S-isoprenylcysteine O-methyltransferase Ste14